MVETVTNVEYARRMQFPSSQAFLAAAALLIMGILGGIMMFYPIPPVNATSVTFILGALAGALTVGPAGKVADRIAATGSGTTINSGPSA